MKKIDSIKKKIIYRAEYRGIKEMDILLSSFVKKYVETLNYQDLEDLYEILKIDDDTIFKWYSGLETKKFPKNKVSNLLKKFKINIGGGGGIRTHETLSRLPVFKTGAFNHSATPPRINVYISGYETN